MKKLLITALLLAFAFSGAIIPGSTDEGNGEGTTTPPTEENTGNENGNNENGEGEGEDYGVMPTDLLCHPIDCWGW